MLPINRWKNCKVKTNTYLYLCRMKSLHFARQWVYLQAFGDFHIITNCQGLLGQYKTL